jgi:hypothetical protein
MNEFHVGQRVRLTDEVRQNPRFNQKVRGRRISTGTVQAVYPDCVCVQRDGRKSSAAYALDLWEPIGTHTIGEREVSDG